MTLGEQIARECIHFNGVMNKECKAGIKYSDVRAEPDKGPYLFPCLKQGGECQAAKFRSDEEVEQELKEIEEISAKALTAMVMVKSHYASTKEPSGKIKCDCGGDLHYTVAQINGHVWAKCGSCGLTFNE